MKLSATRPKLESLSDDEGKSTKEIITKRFAAMSYFPALVVFPMELKRWVLRRRENFRVQSIETL